MSDLRSIMRHFATGVCIVTTYTEQPDGRRHDAVTVNSFTSMSLDPPLVSVCLRADSRFLADMLHSGVCAVSILAAGGEQLARSLARTRDARDTAVQDLPARPGGLTGALVLDAAGWVECKVRDHVTVGDHVLVISEVLAAGSDDDRDPLIFLRGGFHTLEG
ncbi:flavin reductase family protein [Micromonospora endophytica]|uniref:Flavin reductase n=1 Tax=Micromonospora endophytica TaxID=515350 RepID=A0A2W2CMJ7_9ACTN|nr:flavin reductase family protein [Micromonospora endophytica]PZF99200.1 flavin reductase [Micromonospora endophytica]RIW45071.1 flavin reductase [Micromonospora endophytica]BCJ58044.1 flavin reductase [Micromonospora endophytica]